MSKPMRVMIAVTHLLGTGHLARAATLARAFGAAGHEATVISGGMPAAQLDLAGVRLLQLPPLRSDGVNFAQLLDSDGRPASAALMAARADALRGALRDIAPDVLITELYPFGRRSLAAEFNALLDAAAEMSPRPVICASIRDILAPPSKPSKAAQAEAVLQRYYDAVLVHSDPGIAPLEASWPVTASLAPMLRYTGFVAQPPALPHPEGLGAGEVLVSAGGGDVGAPVFHAALDAARLAPRRRWRLLVGGQDAPDRAARLGADAPPNAIVEPARADFRQMLVHAAASVSLCGYNTALDLLQAGTPAVLIPFDAGGEVEQALRAGALSHLPGFAVRKAAGLTGPALLQAVQDVLAMPRRAPAPQGIDGAAETVRITAELAERRI